MEEANTLKPTTLSSKLRTLSDAASLALTTVALLGVYATSYLANVPGSIFENTTSQVSNKYSTQVTPAGFTFAIWGVIYIWQAVWVAYGWSFLCRPKAARTISTGVYIGYAAVNVTNILWLYVWGNLKITTACALLFTLNLFFYPTIGLLVGFFYKISSESDRLDKTLTWILPVNGLFLYVTWTTIASLINLAVVLEYTSGVNVSAADSGTISLSLLLVALVVYFILENSLLYRFLRYVLSVYPVVIWALIGELSAHWGVEGEERNSKFTLGLLVVTVVIFILRICRIGLNMTSPPRHYKALSV